MPSSRNKTIQLAGDEQEEYLRRCVRASSAEPGAWLDRTVWGDSLAVMPGLPRSFADLVVADPPYNLRKDFGGETFCKMGEEEYERYTDGWLALVRPLMRETASIYVCCDWRCSGAVGRALGRRFTVRNRITWEREKGRGALKNWKSAAEDIWFATVSDDYVFNLAAVKQRRRVVAPYRTGGEPKDWEDTPDGKFRDTCPSNFWDDVTVPYWSMAENTPHPTQKPEKLLAKLILASTDPGATVFDPFLGSGTTSVAAKKLGRRYLGIEKNPEYCALAEKRLERAETDRTIQGFSEGVFWERNSGR